SDGRAHHARRRARGYPLLAHPVGRDAQGGGGARLCRGDRRDVVRSLRSRAADVHLRSAVGYLHQLCSGGGPLRARPGLRRSTLTNTTLRSGRITEGNPWKVTSQQLVTVWLRWALVSVSVSWSGKPRSRPRVSLKLQAACSPT